MFNPQVGAVQVWLRLNEARFGVTGSLAFEDETGREVDVDSLSIRGAEREITAWMLSQGYKAAGRWQTEAEDQDGNVMEVSRLFAPGPGSKDVNAVEVGPADGQ